MSSETLKTLFHPFVSGTVEAPGEGERVLFLGAEAGFALPEGFAASLNAVQGFRSLYRQLLSQRIETTPEIEGEDYDAALVLCNKHKGENEANIAAALQRVKVGGLIVIAGGKEDGIQSLRKRMEGFGLEIEHMPKYHGVALWFGRPADISEIVGKFAKPPVRVDGRFLAAAGMFSHDRIDDGSELLASRLPADFTGDVADFGAGWGYLSIELAERSPGVSRLDLYEANHAALEAAKANLEENCPDVPARFFWHDLAGEPVKDKYDLVIMNPPFHEGHAAEPSLGQAMIKTAASALRGGGRLLLVANRGLPYEPVLAANFKESGETCRNARFKVLWAKK
ncbi:class I SAM-dependent methyltransferase [Rhizobium grahamii]|uniref:Class I SAM-dependent methyltransferase n=1 Tax=Rhizobium grahamii TaxID=1120045 RepID=A0A5Q0C7J6_9HYPH|nr:MULTISPECIES: class I SAM-dependent methyltransferase [Rhizobium]QFY61926.1 class I SAM-dependent methyltransferase [Rhizobium grahamii]QRM48898.1 class I SAM-dependent methyltransferase [Rhizobium sp. BG6]